MGYGCLSAAFLCFWVVASKAEDAEGMRGIVRPVDEAWISADLGLRIVSLPFREGETVRKGEMIAAFDCGGVRGEMRGAEARLRAEAITVENNRRLLKARAGGRFELDLSEAKAEQAAADVDTFRAKAAGCEILAPFDGRIALLRVHRHEMPDRTQPLMQLVGTSALEIDMLLPASWLQWLEPGAAFQMELEEIGIALDGEVARLAAVVDPVSQTVKVVGRFGTSDPRILAGMSGPVRFEVPRG